MKNKLKIIFVKILSYSGLPFLIREIFQRKKVTMLVYHDPSPSFALSNFAWLSRHYSIISLDDYLNYRNGIKGAKLPDKALVITLDDGYKGNYALLPVIRNLQIPVTIFLCSGIINTNRHYWFKYKNLKSTSETYKKIPNSLRLEKLNESGFQPEKEFSSPMALSKENIGEMKEQVNFQGHTVFHPCLPQCTDEESWFEIDESKKMLESEYGLAINAIAYPNGDHSAREIEYARKAGYLCGLTVDRGFNDGNTDLFRLKRLSVGDEDSIALLAIKASGIWAFFKKPVEKIFSRVN